MSFSNDQELNDPLINNVYVSALKTGEKDAFNYFFREFYKPLLYYCQSLIHDEEESKDIVINTFSKFWEKRETFENYANIRHFLYLVCRNECFDHLKKKERKVRRERQFVLSLDLISHNDDYLVMEAEILKVIHREIEKLPDKCRKIFKLSYLEGKSIEEISHLLHISSSNVTTQRSRAVQLLRTALSESYLPVLFSWLAMFHPR